MNARWKLQAMFEFDPYFSEKTIQSMRSDSAQIKPFNWKDKPESFEIC